MNDEPVAILVATYNGEKYLAEQIESLLNQTYKNFVLYIRDDNSTDATMEIINKYTNRFPEKIIKVTDDRIAKGAYNNFMFLLEYVYGLNKYNVFMFCDQDDYWLEDKIAITLKAYKDIQENDVPILVHTDLNVVDASLNIISKSFIKYSNLNGSYKNFNNYLIQNNVTGCATLVNKKLVDLVKFDLQDMCMHDWYFALIASAFGKIIYIDKPTINYRQHSNNVLGAKKVKGISGVYNKLIKNNTIKQDLNKLFGQAEAFRSVYYETLSENNKKTIDEFCKICSTNKCNKVRLLIKNKFYKQGMVRVIGEFIFI